MMKRIKSNNGIIWIIIIFTVGTVCLYVAHHRSQRDQADEPTIPKIIHQIWIGTPTFELPPHKRAFMESWKTKMGKDWQYRLWTDEQVTRQNFDLTWDFQREVKRVAAETGTNRFAQLADLMRYEIIYKFGGFYADTNMECFRSLDPYTKHNFVVAHENGSPTSDSCSTGFFGASQGHPLLKAMLNNETLSKRNYGAANINDQTGPGFFGPFVHAEGGAHVLDTNKVYPAYQGGGFSTLSLVEQDKCLSMEKMGSLEDNWREITYKKHTLYWQFPCDQYPRSLMADHFAFGASWK